MATHEERLALISKVGEKINSLVLGGLRSLNDDVTEARNEIERLQKINEQAAKDWCEDDEGIRKQAMRVLDPKIVEGDTWHVPRMAELAEMMADEIESLKKEVEDADLVFGAAWRQAVAEVNGVAQYDREKHVALLASENRELSDKLEKLQGLIRLTQSTGTHRSCDCNCCTEIRGIVDERD
jgi:hypothetical protein